MAEKQSIGVYWDSKEIYFTNSKSFFASIPLPKKKPTANEAPTSRPLTAQIQDLLSKYNIKKPLVNLSIPTEEIIFRSFVIPWMQPNEIENVVTFEASKYIPFPLEELTYSFHPVNISKDNIKRYRVIFVAIKKETVDEYINILKRAEIELQVVEPSAISLIRLLKFNNLMPENRPVALVEQNGLSGKILVIHQLIPHFVREFKLSMGEPGHETADPAALYTRLMNEIRISLDYFGRQDNQIQVRDLFMLGTEDNSLNIKKRLEVDLGIPTQLIKTEDLLKNIPQQDSAFIHAIGTSLLNSVPIPANFNLIGNQSSSSKKRWTTEKKDLNIKAIIVTAIICGFLLMVSLLNTVLGPKKTEQELLKIRQALGPYSGQNYAFINQTNESLKTKLTAYQKIRIKSDFTQLLNVIDQLLPEGVWLENLNIFYGSPITNDNRYSSYSETNPSDKLQMTFTGFAYSENSREQFRLTSTLLRNIKENVNFKTTFQNIDIEKTETRTIGDHMVTFFSIKCE